MTDDSFQAAAEAWSAHLQDIGKETLHKVIEN
jgi:hypothetical protein